MNLYRVISTAGTRDLIVKAKNAKEAYQVSRDVIEEELYTAIRHISRDEPYVVYVTKLIQPENDGVGHCYLENKSKTYTFKRT